MLHFFLFVKGINTNKLNSGFNLLDFLDNSQERYDRFRYGSGTDVNYIIIQYGICAFKWDPSSKK